MALLATNPVIHQIIFILILTANQCLSSIDNNVRHETIVSSETTESSLVLQKSLDYYKFETNCKQKTVSQQKKEVLIVSTLDGRLSAVDVLNGDQIWSKKFSSEPLLSSTISDFEITRRGQVVRVVPSLDGNLYLYNGKTIEGIPLNAETLLKSSYKLGDDLVITGGQESQISGIDLFTGRVSYECDINGCPSDQMNENETFDDLFLLKRIKQTVRAIDPRNGRQKWYFSVTEPQLNEISSSECDSNSFEQQLNENQKTISETKSQKTNETNFKILVPNGFVSAHRYANDNDVNESIEWSHRFESPIVHVWHYRNGRLNALNLFDKQKLFGFTNDINMNGFEPSVYIGLYRQQWYVQTSEPITAQISERKNTNDLLSFDSNHKKDSNVMQIEWKPKAMIFDNENDVKSESNLQLVPSPHFSLSLSSNTEESLGYYILDAIEEKDGKCSVNSSEEQPNDWDNDCDEDNGIIEQIVIISSLSYYWREVTAISIGSAFLLNFLYSFLKRKFKTKCKTIVENNCTENDKNIDTNEMTSQQPPTPVNPLDNNGFNSRYESDFTPIQVLGRGGFGLVFEAKHIIDESHYAVKRICLPFRREQREKMMREVRALSKLDHSGIVRYYNAWVELPPPGWQEFRDKQLDTEDMTGTQFNELYHRNNQKVVNRSYASAHNKSIPESCETTSETNYCLNIKSKQLSFETESNQSLDIVFDENYSSIKVIENNVYNTLSNNSHQKTSKSIETEIIDSMHTRSRPKVLIPSLPRCYLYIQMQLCRKDTLKDWLFSNSINRDINIVLDLFDQIVSAVDYVHSMGLMHRDLKPSNIFFSMNGSIKIGDFGLVTATAVDDDIHTPGVNSSDDDYNSVFTNSSSTHTNKVGTAVYMSPEQIRNLPYSDKVDIFSMGIILFELLVPFKTEMERNVLLNNARKQIFSEEFRNKFSSEYDLLKNLLALNPEDRPSTLEIKEHEVLQNLERILPIGRQRSRTISLSTFD